MKQDRRVSLDVVCDFCGDESHIMLVKASLPETALVYCPVCGGSVGTLGSLTR